MRQERGHILPSTVAPTEDVDTIIGQPATSFQAFAEHNAVVWTAKEDK
jgi:hypothetical protein